MELLWQKSRRGAVREPGRRSPGAPSSALLPQRAYLKLPACHWDQRQGPGWEGRVSAGPLVKLTAGAKTSNLNPIPPPPPRHPYTLLRSPLQHHSCISFHLRRGREAAALAGARCCWRSSPRPGVPGPSPAPPAAGLGSTGCWGRNPAPLPSHSPPTTSWDRARSHGFWCYFSRARAVPVLLWLPGWSEHHQGVGSFLTRLGCCRTFWSREDAVTELWDMR